VHIAWRHHAPGGGNAYLGLGEVLFTETHGPEHGAAGRIGNAIDNNPRVLSRVYVAVIWLGHKSITPSADGDYPVALSAEQPRRAFACHQRAV
jgi:hypothetical protein